MGQKVDTSQYELVSGADTAPAAPQLAASPGASYQAPAAAPASQPAPDAPPSQSLPVSPTSQPAAQQPNQKLDPSSLEEMPSYANGLSPETPINKSPLSVIDHLALSMGNKSGEMQYLKTRFQDVTKNKDGDLLVKDQGIWHRVDPNGLTDPDAWETTRKIVGKLADRTGSALDIAGQFGGAALGSLAGPVGAVTGGSIGAAAGEGLRTSLGRLIGTYDATPEQQAKDVGWEGLLGAGGEVLGLGIKPAFGMLKGALNTVDKWGTNFAKENLSAIFGETTGAGRWAIRRAMDDPDAVISAADEAIKKIGISAPRDQAVGVLADRQGNIVKTIASQGDQALKSQYAKDMGQVVANAPDSFKADIGDIMTNTMKQMEASGYGARVGQGASERFKVFSDADVAARLSVPEEQLPKVMGQNTRAAVEKVADMLNTYKQMGTVSGKEGVQKLVQFKRAINETFSELMGDDTPKAVQQVVGTIKDNIDQGIGQKLLDNGGKPLLNAYTNMNERYSTSVDAVRMFKDAVKNGSVDSLVKQLESKSGAYRSLKDEASTVANLMGQSGQNMMQTILDLHAAKNFVDFVPKPGGSSANWMIKAAGVVTQQGNPRVVGKQIQYGTHMNDFLKSLPTPKLRALLGSDEMVAKLATPILQAYRDEDSLKDQMVGAATGGGQQQ